MKIVEDIFKKNLFCQYSKYATMTVKGLKIKKLESLNAISLFFKILKYIVFEVM